jgi:hypothetical protein
MTAMTILLTEGNQYDQDSQTGLRVIQMVFGVLDIGGFVSIEVFERYAHSFLF